MDLHRRLMAGFGIAKVITDWPEYALSCIGAGPRCARIRLRNGISFRIRKGEPDLWTISEVWVHRIYNPPGFSINPGDLVIDIGAHIGAFSVFAASAGATVESFEPHPDNHRMLRANLRINGFASVKTHNAAVGGKEGRRRLFLPENESCCNSFFPQGKDLPSAEVDCTTLDKIVLGSGIRQVDLLKLDCEGAEYEILMSASDGALSRIRKISLEYHDGLVPGRDHRKLSSFLEEKGFEVTLRPPLMYASRTHIRQS
ncbi:MAG: FkbM family methyltransferase [Candidatus Micrarchaeia archaeon]